MSLVGALESKKPTRPQVTNRLHAKDSRRKVDKRPKKTPTKADPTKKYLMQMFMKRKSNQPEAMQNFLSKT